MFSILNTIYEKQTPKVHWVPVWLGNLNFISVFLRHWSKKDGYINIVDKLLRPFETEVILLNYEFNMNLYNCDKKHCMIKQ